MINPENPEWMWSAQVSLDGRYLELYITKDTSRVCYELPMGLYTHLLNFF